MRRASGKCPCRCGGSAASEIGKALVDRKGPMKSASRENQQCRRCHARGAARCRLGKRVRLEVAYGRGGLASLASRQRNANSTKLPEPRLLPDGRLDGCGKLGAPPENQRARPHRACSRGERGV